ncbi:MAG: tRNA (guanosine(46)-N7)-methyltransferase TrmB [Ruminococcus sp.]|nr:tRNA (guanosine(46)-N7)-methyltransferase TrmB [Ruminococcus sp.]
MRIRKKKWAEPELAVCDFFVQNPEENAGKWKLAFKKEQPLYLEIGCGKGGFAGQLALQNPDKNIIAVDIKIDMLGVGRRNIVKLFEDAGKTSDDIDNLLLVNYNVEKLNNIITSEDKIDRLYINFCNPWPRPKHNKRRLTYFKKLEMYKSFLQKDSEIRFKTDDEDLFNDSLEYFEQSGYEIIYITRDLHASDVKDNIQTEHEKMFSAEGIKIKYCIAKQK